MATEETYKFILIDSKVPVIRGKKIITDSNVGGIKNTYDVYKVGHYFFGLINKYLGTKTFLRPYQSIWPKGNDKRLPAPYWGKGPLLNLWLVLSNNYDDINNVRTLLPEDTTKSHCTKIFDTDFRSQLLVKNLKSNKSFYQSKFVKL